MTSEPGVRPAIAMLLLASVVTAHLAAQQNPQPRTPERGADHLAVHFAVVAADGTPVTDLRAEEVTVRIGGRVRPIRSLQRIASAGTPGAIDVSADLPLPFGTNAVAAAGRTLLMLIDDESFRPGLEGVLRQAAAELIKGLAPTDRVALVTLPLGGTRVPFTSDHARLRTAVAQIVGHAPANLTGSDLACRTRRTLESVVTYLESLGVRDEPLTMMFVTAGLAAPRRDAVSALAPGMCELSEHLFSRVAVAAGAARAQFYVIRPGDAPDAGSSVQRESGSGSDNPLAGIEHVAGVTGGKLLSLTGSAGTAMERVLRETAAYYLVSVDTGRNDRTGRSQQLDVDVSRDGTEVRTQPHITFARTDPASAKLLQPSLRDMLGTPVVFRDLPLRAAGFPALDAEPHNVRIVTLAEPVETGVKLESLAAVLFDRDGKVASQWLATAEELQRRPVMGAMSTPPGAYRLRVAAIDVDGRSGTADYDVTAEIVRTGPLRLSSLVLGLSRGGTFVPKLQFTNEPLAIAYLELEGAPAGAKVAAGLEVARTLNGPAIAAMPLTIENASGNRYAAMGSVAIGALPPGDYVVRAIVGLEGHPMTRVVKALRKVK
jgi:VWFA-related protein